MGAFPYLCGPYTSIPVADGSMLHCPAVPPIQNRYSDARVKKAGTASFMFHANNIG